MPKGFVYKSYNFTDKDPIIDEIRTVVQDAGVTYQFIENESGVTTNTLHAWFKGKTRRPQAATVNAVLRAIGKKLGIVDLDAISTPASVAEQAKAAKQVMGHVIRMNKIRRAK